MRGLLLLGALAILGSTALARDPRGTTIVEFYGPHPIDPGVHSGLCGIEGPHMHSYRPHDEVLYVNDGPYWTFVGDPTEFEPAAPAPYAYYGHHPVWWTNAPGEHYCYITGPHHHGYKPSSTVQFTERGGAYWYVGGRPAWYERHKGRHRMDDHYHDHVIMRPVVSVSPPTGWVGVTFGLDGVAVEFGGPVVIHRPAPTYIDDDHHRRGPPAWGHHKDDKHFPGNNGGGKPGKGKGKHK